jgi:antitoxin component of MazEF toxin-antitoxin module
MSIKIRKVGTSHVLTVPKNIVPKAEEYDVFEGRDGAIIYLPTRKNPFDDEDFLAKNDLKQKEDLN